LLEKLNGPEVVEVKDTFQPPFGVHDHQRRNFALFQDV